MRIHPLISKTDQLNALVERLAKHPFIAVDTEFMRENTYWPDLCLIQVASSEEAAAIDPKAEGIDLTSLLDLFVKNSNVLKVFHAGGQDLEIIHNLTGKMPVPLFDTQIAAMALGHGEQIGYSNLIESLLGHSLDKGARFTDWSRPKKTRLPILPASMSVSTCEHSSRGVSIFSNSRSIGRRSTLSWTATVIRTFLPRHRKRNVSRWNSRSLSIISMSLMALQF